MSRFDNKVAFITGAGQGIGEAAARMMAAEGASVVIADVNQPSGESVAESIRGGGGQALYVFCDVTNSESVTHAMNSARDAFGGIDILHNNAGIHESALSKTPSSFEISEEDWQRVIDINLKGVWLCSKLVVPFMEARGGGVIVNASSTGGIVGYPAGSAYGSSKAGVIQLTRVMALELAPKKIRVNAYAPGAASTPMVTRYYESFPIAEQEAVISSIAGTHLIPRLQTPEEVANVVLFLASSESNTVMGTCITVDAGSLAWRGQNA